MTLKKTNWPFVLLSQKETRLDASQNALRVVERAVHNRKGNRPGRNIVRVPWKIRAPCLTWQPA
jgi:hypothetical protein